MVMRVGGLASGMDIDALVEKLMQAERTPLNKLQQKKQTYEWQRDAYRGVNTKLKNFDTYIADNLVLKTLNTKTASSSNAENVSATASSTASGTVTIESVSKLAKAARAVGTDTGATANTKLQDLGFTGTSFSIKAIQSDGTMATTDTTIEYTADTTVGELVNKINASNAGVNAIFEKGQLSITAKNTGKIGSTDEAAEIQVTSNVEDFRRLGFNSLDNAGNLATNGENAEFMVNGIATERATNNFSLNGYNINLKKVFTNATEPVSITSTNNIDDSVNKIKEFVSKYNELIKGLIDQTRETKYRDYAPLTAEQKEDMEESEIKLWEEKAKSGLLRNDSMIRNGLSDMRSLVYQSNPGVADARYNTLYSIGITTSKNYNDGGTLEIDETKLRQALEENPDAVEQLLKNTSGKKADVVNGETVDTRGYFAKLRDSMKTMESNIEKKAGRSTMTNYQFALGKSLIDTENRISTWQTKLENIEARYWKQFTAMESAINKANEQSSALFSGQ